MTVIFWSDLLLATYAFLCTQGITTLELYNHFENDDDTVLTETRERVKSEKYLNDKLQSI